MKREESLSHKAINAGNFLGWDQYIGSGAEENLVARYPVRAVEIPRATAGTTTTSQSIMISDNTTLVGRYVPNDIRKLKKFVNWLPITDIKHNENLGHPTLDVFDELQKIRADETHFRAILHDFRSLTTVRERESIAKRLEALLGDFQDDYGRCLDVESLRTFVALFSLHPELRQPTITAAENGNLFAEWKTDDGKRFLGLQMLPTHQVRFVAIRPNATYPQLRKYASGVTSVEQLFTDLPSYDILAWACAA